MAKDRLQHLYRYNITQTEVLGKDYTDIDLRGRACVWVPGKGIFLPADPGIESGDVANAVPFGVIQRVFVTGARQNKLQEYQTKGRTVTVLQHGVMPDFLARAAVTPGSLLAPFGAVNADSSDGGDFADASSKTAAELADLGKWRPFNGFALASLRSTTPATSAAEARKFLIAMASWPMLVQAMEAGTTDNRFVAYIH